MSIVNANLSQLVDGQDICSTSRHSQNIWRRGLGCCHLVDKWNRTLSFEELQYARELHKQICATLIWRSLNDKGIKRWRQCSRLSGLSHRYNISNQNNCAGLASGNEPILSATVGYVF